MRSYALAFTLLCTIVALTLSELRKAGVLEPSPVRQAAAATPVAPPLEASRAKRQPAGPDASAEAEPAPPQSPPATPPRLPRGDGLESQIVY